MGLQSGHIHSQQLALKSDITSFCKLDTGTYTGNASNNRNIDVTFTPRHIKIWWFNGGNTYTVFVNDQVASWTSGRDEYGDSSDTNGISISAYSGATYGFQVNNNHASDFCNANGITYYWTAWG